LLLKSMIDRHKNLWELGHYQFIMMWVECQLFLCISRRDYLRSYVSIRKHKKKDDLDGICWASSRFTLVTHRRHHKTWEGICQPLFLWDVWESRHIWVIRRSYVIRSSYVKKYFVPLDKNEVGCYNERSKITRSRRVFIRFHKITNDIMWISMCNVSISMWISNLLFIRKTKHHS
jgi:hypothetical protein